MMVTLTLSAPDAATLAAALASLRREHQVVAVDDLPTDRAAPVPDNVRRLRRQDRAS